jgi:dsDNA-binding SOS-regulon protein
MLEVASLLLTILAKSPVTATANPKHGLAAFKAPDQAKFSLLQSTCATRTHPAMLAADASL